MRKNTLSVVMPNYNHAHYIGEIIEAILSQSFKPKEVIVVDDGSTDNSVDIIQKFVRRDNSIIFLRNEHNMGIFVSLNKALEHVSGDYIYFSAADDKILRGFFEKSMNILSQYPQAGLCSTLSLHIDEKGKNIGLFPTPVVVTKPSYFSQEKVKKLLNLYGSWFMGNATIYRREAFIKNGGFIPELLLYTDNFLSKVLALKYGACFIPEPLAAWRRMEKGFSSTMVSKPEMALQAINNYLELTQSTYRGLFPQKHIKDWKKTQFYWIGEANLRVLQGQQETFLKHLRQAQPERNLDRFFYLFFRFSMRTQSLFTKLYLMVRNFTWSAARSMFSIILFRFILFVGKKVYKKEVKKN